MKECQTSVFPATPGEGDSIGTPSKNTIILQLELAKQKIEQ